MKATFICGVCGVLAFAASGCVGLELPPDGNSELPCIASECMTSHALEGELVLFVNARLTDASSSFQGHLELDEPGTFLGNALYLYDPNKTCDEGGNACRVVELGHLILDERLGDISVGDLSLRKFVVRDLAWHPSEGLWATTFDTYNDEWSISKLGLVDWTKTGNAIDVERWVIKPGPAESPSTDPCYWFEAVSGLGFAGDELLLGVRGAGSKGLVTDGSLLRIDRAVFEQGHCVYEGDITQDPQYYACESVCEQWCSFGPKVGVAGDVIAQRDGLGASAWLRSEDAAIMPLSLNQMATCATPEAGEVSDATFDDLLDDEVVRGDEIDGLARVGGVLYGLSVLGKVYRIDEDAGTVELVDDLAPLFPEQGLRLRGATEVVVPAGE